ncbi:MAG: hypothetical protein H6855_00915 [Rhodospirillales bacterium]|nr:hypothetical protein [Rhodospirillales bacterium]MCB9964630.1 hypothetical protein [Rhodospirillales bacterium]MCB9979920.1 hypothetical protein [Rhodospirillales bacterium]
MLRLLWFLLRIGLLVGGAMWLSARPGTVNIQWMDYDINIHFGFFLLILLVLLMVAMGLTRLGIYMSTLPERHRDRKVLKNTEKGLEALTLSLSAAAAGDYGHTQYQAERALKFLPGYQPLPLILQSGAQRKQGDFEKADATLKTLLSHPEGAVLAARALIGNAIEQNNIPAALIYARTAEKDYKGRDSGWLLKSLYELEARAGNWEAAESALQKALKKKAVSKDQGADDLKAMMTAQALDLLAAGQTASAEKILKKVVRQHTAFIPAVESLCERYLEAGKKRAATSLLKAAWSAAPHPLLVRLWREVGRLSGKKETDVSWIQKLVQYYPDHYESDFALANVQAVAGLTEDARKSLERAIEKSPQRRFYKLAADLAQKAGGSAASIHHYLEAMSDARPDPIWVCPQTGALFERWHPLVPPQGDFNVLVWGFPDELQKSAGTGTEERLFSLLTNS